MAMSRGTINVDFGAGGTLAQVNVTGQSGIKSDSMVDAWLNGVATANNDLNAVTNANLTISCSAPSAGSGFTVFVKSPTSLTGLFNLSWVWTDAPAGALATEAFAVAMAAALG